MEDRVEISSSNSYEMDSLFYKKVIQIGNKKKIIDLLQKSNLFKDITINKNLIKCEKKENLVNFGLYPNKKKFFGFYYKNKIPNFTKHLDSIDINLKLDFPFINPELQFFNSLRNKYFDKFSTKIRYNFFSIPLQKKIILSLSKSEKTDFNYINTKITLKNIFEQKLFPIEFQINKYYIRTEDNKKNENLNFKLKYKKNNINRKEIPIGSKKILKFQNSFLNKKKSNFYFNLYYKGFFDNLIIISENSNLEIESDIFVTNSSKFNKYNLRGFFNRTDRFYSKIYYYLFFSLKINYFNEIKKKDLNFFFHFSGLKEIHNKSRVRFGIGLEKKFKDFGQFECIFNFFTNRIQLRFFKD